MAIQKQIVKEEQVTQRSGIGVSLNSLPTKNTVSSNSQADRNTQEITAYAKDIRKSLLVGGFVILVELALYFFKIIK
ncbi:MAG: hypothetical protein M3Q44_04420 [bacterium]|nr:hypothetical protein [bacterium]